jgi:hypothetical protein
MAIQAMIDNGAIVSAVTLLDVASGRVQLDESDLSYNEAQETLSITLDHVLPDGTYDLRLDGSIFRGINGEILFGGTSGLRFDMPVFDLASYLQSQEIDIHVGSYSTPFLVDWNSDGLTDLLVGEKTDTDEGKIRVYLNQRTNAIPAYNGFTYVQTTIGDLTVPASGCLGVFPRVYDWNGDGTKDLVLGLADGHVKVAFNLNTASEPRFGLPEYVQVGEPAGKTDIDVGDRATLDILDWNNDGRPDLIVGGLDGRVRVFINESDSEIPDLRLERIISDGATDLLVPTGRASVAVTDLNGDGRKDLILGNTEGQLWLYPNVGTDANPAFDGAYVIQAAGVEIDLAGSARSRPFVGDFNGDGTPDLLVGSEDGLVRVYNGLTAGGPVELTEPIYGEVGGWFIHTFEIVPNNAPTAHAGGPYTVSEGGAVLLNGSGSTDPDQPANTLTCTWDLDGDGQFDDAEGLTPIFSAAALDGHAGSAVTVWLRVTDECGISDDATATINITNVAPSLVDLTVIEVDEGNPSTLTASVIDPGMADTFTLAIDWGDGTIVDIDPATSPISADHSYANSGSYSAVVMVRDDDGGESTYSLTVSVSNVAPTARAGGPYTVPEGGSILLNAGASTDPGSDIATYHWDLDNDGQFDDATGMQPTFSAAGLDGPTTVTIGLKVTDDDGAADTTTVQISVTNVAPTADAGGPYSTLDGGTVLLSAAASTDPGGDIASYHWDLDGDGTYDTSGKTVYFSTDQVGPHEVTLLVTDSSGASDTATAQVTVSYGEMTDLGTVTFNTVEGVYPATGNRWYRVTTSQAGFLTVISTPASGTATLALYDTSRTEPPLATGSGSDAVHRFDHEVEFGETYLVRVSGTSNDVDLTLLNLVNHEEAAVAVSGTDQDDSFAFTAGDTRVVTINGVSYEFANTECTWIGFEGAGGDDSATLTGSSDGETARLYPDRGSFGENGYLVLVNSVSSITAHSGGGVDVAFMYDSPGDDEFFSRKGYGKLWGDGFALETFGFMYNYGYATTRDGGTDIARMEDTPGSDKFKFDWPASDQFFGKMYGGGIYYNRAKNFEQIEAVMTDGKNQVRLYDSEGNDTFYGQRDRSRLTGTGFDVTISGYDSLIAYASKGTDLAYLEDSDENDTIRARPHKVMLWGGDDANPTYAITARKFDKYHFEANSGGYDRAKLHDTVLDDHVDAAGNSAQLFRNDAEKNLLYEAIAFEWVRIYGTPNGGQITNRNTLTKTDPLDFDFIYDPALWEELP